MINFRYHVISLATVFAATAAGLVVGNAAGDNPTTGVTLRSQVDILSEQKDELQGKVTALNDESKRQEQAWVDAAGAMLPGRLGGRRVLIVNSSAGKAYVDGVQQLLLTAGAKVTGRLQLEDRFTDPANNDELLDLAMEAAPSGTRGTLPSRSSGVESSADLLASILIGSSVVDGTRTVLAAYQEFISAVGEPSVADAVLFLAGPPYTGGDAARRNAAVVMFVGSFAQAGRVVVAVPAADGAGNVVQAVRGSADLARKVSTVDDVSTAVGRLGVVLALAEQFGGRTGHYGAGPGATASVPHA